MSYAGSNLQAVLDQLSRATGVVHRVGKREDAQALMSVAGTEPLVVWVPKASLFVRPTEQPEDGKAVAERRITFDVSVYADEFQDQVELEDKLVAAGLREFSENAFDPFVGGSSPFTGNDLRAVRFGRTVPVMLRLPVYEAVYLPGSIGEPDINGGRIVNTQGAQPEELTP